MPTRRRTATRSSTRSPARRPARRSATPPAAPVAGAGERVFVLDVPYGTRFPDAAWHPGVKAAVWVGEVLPPHLAPYASVAYTYERFVEDALNGGTPGPPLAGVEPMTPRENQFEGAGAIAAHAGAGGPMFLLADDTGVGKTVTAVIGAKAAAAVRGGSRILVVADRPASITVGHWCRTIAGVGDGGLTWCVTTWDRLRKVSGHPWDVVIADEVQMIRHRTTARWKEWVKIAGLGRATRVPYVIAASATPGQTPLELPYLAPVFAHALDEPKSRWVKGFDASLIEAGLHITRGRYGPQWTDDATERAGDLTTLRGWLGNGAPTAMLARPAAWGPCQVNGMPVTLTPAERARYDAGWAAFCAEMNLARQGRSVAKGRAALLRFRQKAGLIRVDATADWVAAQVAAGRQVAVSVEYVGTAADPLRDALEAKGVAVACLYGQGRFDAETERVRFQTGAAPAAVLTIATSISLHAGEVLPGGLTATSAPRVGVFHQARYSGIQGKQITGRTHRDGQRSDWHVLYAEHTVEETVARVMVERYAAAMDTVGGDTSALTQIAELLGADWLPSDALA
jgi:hypothetical protein